ncbi:MAG: FAD-dependent oxidoreductase [Armatimonadota bacterium]
MSIVNTVLVVVLTATIGWAAPAPSSVPAAVVVDVLVVGGTPGGVAAAMAAARAGANVLLVEADPWLGGVLTSAWLTTFDLNMSQGKHLTRGIFLEFFRRLGLSFDRSDAAEVMGRAVVRESRLKTMIHTRPVRVVMDGSRIAGVEFEDLQRRRLAFVRASQVIDATDDADIAATAGAPHVVGRAGDRVAARWMQAATLIFRVGGVDWRVLAQDIADRLASGAQSFAWGVNGRAAWGFPDEAARYQPSDPRVLVYPLNLALQDDGSVLINALNITLINGLDAASVDAGMAMANAELPGLIMYLRRAIPGFAGARLLDHAPSLYIRETRHIVGLYTLTAGDIFSGRVFEDRIAVASYPIDIHPYYAGWTNLYPRVAMPYTIPFRTIVPERPRNLLVASRALSATSEAHGSARIVPTAMALGQAAGVAAALAVSNGWTPRQIAEDAALVRTLQATLIAQGAYLGETGRSLVAAERSIPARANDAPASPAKHLARSQRLSRVTTEGASGRDLLRHLHPCSFSLAVPPPKVKLDLRCR